MSLLGRTEIRMGSPYNTCRVSLRGDWVPELPNRGRDFQDLKAWSPDLRHLARIRWAVRWNEPGFKVVVVSLRTRSVTQTRRRGGCCHSLRWEEGAFKVRSSFSPDHPSIAIPASAFRRLQ